MFKFYKYFICTFVVFFLIWSVFIYQNLRSATPSLPSLVNNLNSFSSAIVFNYSKNIDKQMYLFSKNIGLENNPLTKQTEPPPGNIGADGFFIFDIQPEFTQNLFLKLDNVLNATLDFLEASSNQNQPQAKLIVDETETKTDENPFSSPLSGLIQEIFNGKTFLFGGATQFHLSFKDTFKLALAPKFKNYLNLNTNFFRDMIIKNVPVYLQDFLTNHSIHVDIEPSVTQLDNSIHESQIIIAIDDSQDFLESICSLKINPWDLCGRFSINIQKFITNIQSILGLVSHNFKISMNIYWSLRGKDIIYSNQKDFILKILDPNQNKKSTNILKEVSSSGDDFLYAGNNNLNYTILSFYFDMIKTQNECIRFLESLKLNSKVMSDYFASPEGTSFFSKLESSIYDITRFSQKTSISFKTDGVFLYPELRLYSPSMDLFLQNGKQLSPEFINSLRVFVTKTVSFGNYLLPRGLVPLPGPFLSKNGRWVILNSNILIKSIAPYLESIDPYIDINEKLSPL